MNVIIKLDGEKVSLDSAIINNIEIFKKVNKIYHYTTLDTLYKILDSKALKFSRNDRLNDMLEHSRSVDAGFNYYVSCFTHDGKESIPLWFMYAQKMGVRISINSKDIFTNRVCFYDGEKKKYFSYEVRGSDGDKPIYENVYEIDGKTITISKPHGTLVTYDDEMLLLSHTQKFGGGSYHFSTTNVYQLSAIKGSAWEYEHETRYFLTTNSNCSSIESVFIELEDSVFNEFQIVFSPFYTKAECDKLQNDLRSKYPNVKFDFPVSSLHGKIQ